MVNISSACHLKMSPKDAHLFIYRALIIKSEPVLLVAWRGPAVQVPCREHAVPLLGREHAIPVSCLYNPCLCRRGHAVSVPCRLHVVPVPCCGHAMSVPCRGEAVRRRGHAVHVPYRGHAVPAPWFGGSVHVLAPVVILAGTSQRPVAACSTSVARVSVGWHITKTSSCMLDFCGSSVGRLAHHKDQ